ncbi:MAG: SBBP repeat-containing protein [Chloroflexota bacterium]
MFKKSIFSYLAPNLWRLLFCAVLILSTASAPWQLGAEPGQVQPGAEQSGLSADNLLQFTAGGHVLGFRPEGVWIAAADHLLSVQFIDAAAVEPAAAQPAAEQKNAPPLEQVKYENLWPGVSLVYEATPDGVLKSSYLLAPGAQVEAIRLEYNQAPQLDADGSLHFSFENGEMVEATPVAWQESAGLRQPVQAAFQLYPGGQVGFQLGAYDSSQPVVIDPLFAWIHWNAFLGDYLSDEGYGITLDDDGSAYVVGWSEATWGDPERAFQGGKDAFAVKLDSSGELVWHNFLGGAGDDIGYHIALGRQSVTYEIAIVVGESEASWGSPEHPFQGGTDTFVAALDKDYGSLKWNTFLGSSGDDCGEGIAAVEDNLFVTGWSDASWGSPVRAFSGGDDAFVASLDGLDGSLNWNTFLGSSHYDHGTDIALGASDIYVIGYSLASWGSPYRPYSGNADAFVAALDDGNGNLAWNTFLGSSSGDYGYGIDLDVFGDLYVVGRSSASWQGSYPPERAFSGSQDAFVAKITDMGILQWNTFLGSSGSDWGEDIAVDRNHGVYVIGTSNSTWGAPLEPHSGGGEAYIAKLYMSGGLWWNTFGGTDSYDKGYGIAVDTRNPTHRVYFTGHSRNSWGPAVHPNSGADASVVQATSGGEFTWTSFLGCSSHDEGSAITVDVDGNVYVAGFSQHEWGAPRRHHSNRNDDLYDAFVAKLDAMGVRQWHTFLGGTEDDKAYGMTVNHAGEVFVTGSSGASWGSPRRSFSGEKDAFVAKLSYNGDLVWNTFLGGSDNDGGKDIRLNSKGYSYVVGSSSATWGLPWRSHSGSSDIFIAKLNTSGMLFWNTFQGGSGSDAPNALVMDDDNNLYITGTSTRSWGSPINEFDVFSLTNAFVAKLDYVGSLQWNTFMGVWETNGWDIDIDHSGNLYVTGMSAYNWGSPIRACNVYDAFVAKFSNSGTLLWNTFLGSDVGIAVEVGRGISVDGYGNAYVTGIGAEDWGSPIDHYNGGIADVLIAKLNTNGNLQWHTFLGTAGDDHGYAILSDPNGSGAYFVTGDALDGFGSPFTGSVNSTNGDDAFVLRSGNFVIWLPLTIGR